MVTHHAYCRRMRHFRLFFTASAGVRHLFIDVAEGLCVYPKNMMLNLSRTNGLIYSQCVLLALMKKGLGRPQAYDIVQKNAFTSRSFNRDFKEVLLSDPKVKRYLTTSDIEACFDIRYYLRHIGRIFKNLGL